MRIKEFFFDFNIPPISPNPLHGVIRDEVLESMIQVNKQKRIQAINQLGSKWLLHKENQVQRMDKL